MNALTSLFAYAGLASLALAMSRHHRTVFSREIAPRRRLALRTAGWLLLTLSVAVAFQTHGFGLGAVSWFATVASAGFVLTLLLAYAPRLWPLPLACLLLLAALLLTAARADSSAPAATDEVVVLDRFEVTGEKLGRTAQETQTSVAAFTGTELARTTDTSLADILQRTANVFAGNGTFSIRGISNEGFAGLASSPLASVVLDGANLDNKMVFEGVLAAWDLDQIEILRGPQSTSQGRNSLAGAVVARTKNPTFTWDGQARATYASASPPPPSPSAALPSGGSDAAAHAPASRTPPPPRSSQALPDRASCRSLDFRAHPSAS